MKTGRWSWMAAALVCLLAISGCVSASLEDAAPTSDTTTGAVDPQAADAALTEQTTVPEVAPEGTEIRDNSFVEEGAIQDDSFPTFERPPIAANEQISDEEKERLLAEMDALKASMSRRGAGAGDSDAQYRELQDLAREHADETKKQIEQ